MKNSAFVRRHAANPDGRDLVVGDIHGCFSKLEKALISIGFDESVDRLFSVGDLVDRGPESHRVTEWLDKPWFFPVQGNHEDMAIRYVTPGQRNREHYLMNGGGWLISTSPHEQHDFALAMAALPYAIEVETNAGLVGIVHADIAGSTWSEMIERFAAADSNNKLKAITNDVLWCRDRIEAGDRSGVADIRAVIVGHTPLKRPAILGNVYHIDTGGWTKGGDFTFLDLRKLTFLHPATSLDWESA